MTAGISVFNEQNSLQIDDRYDTYTLNKKYVTKNISPGILPTGINAFSPTVLGGEIWTGDPSSQKNDVTVYSFVKGLNSTDNFGLQVFKEDGSTAFHSGSKPLRVVDFVRRAIRKTNGNTDFDSITKNYSGYGRLGVVIPNSIPVPIPLGGTAVPMTGLSYPTAVINTNGDIVFGYRIYNTVGGVSDGKLQGYNDFIVVDLTDY